jgi:hypothetical protein
MSNPDVKNKLIKLAYENPELREVLLPIINKTAARLLKSTQDLVKAHPKHKINAEELDKALRDLKDNPNKKNLNKVNDAMGGHGVEYVESENGKWSAEYVNMGDTYKSTVMIQEKPKKAVIIGRSWGDYIEKYDL